jgi:tetratricopeptide (TPR) repeat protein
MSASRPQRDLASARAAFRSGDMAAAEKLLRRVLAREPSHFGAHELMGYVLGNRGDAEGAFKHLRKATQSASASAESWYYLARSFRDRGRHGEAVDAIGKAMSLRGEFPEALHDLGVALFELGKSREALAALDRARALAPGVFEIHYNRGRALDALQRYGDALASYAEALRLAPAHVGSWTNCGAVLHDLGRFEEALVHYDRALELSPTDEKALVNRAVTLRALDRLPDALEAYDRALALYPRNAEAWTFRGAVLDELGRPAEALQHYARALAIDPAFAEARWNEALTRLTLGEFEAGWEGFESRWLCRRPAGRRHTGTAPWLGKQPLQGKRILAWAEQGYGDTIQFCRYVPLLAERGADVVLEAPAALAGLLASLPACTVAVNAAADGGFDYQVPLLSLPLAFGTHLASVPNAVPYLSISPGRAREWADRIRKAEDRPRIGIACSGSEAHLHDRKRSMALREFDVLRPHASLYVIQKGLREADQGYLREAVEGIRYLGDEIRDFGDTAAIIANLDLVVSVDTAVAHLAGALGKDVWILLPQAAEWRWLVGRSDSPWYPTARLFRQERRGDWAGVMSRVREALQSLAA